VVVHGTKGLTGFKKPSVAAGELGDHFFILGVDKTEAAPPVPCQKNIKFIV
tara:strand:+ start:647 stop:799 length:153 start_codon:yes stop_codon:yes gene_type:complete